MTAKTGEKCVSAGKYHCQTHPAITQMMKVDEIFPKCTFSAAAHETTWVKEETT